MANVEPQPAAAAPSGAVDHRTLAIVVYGLYLGALFCGGLSWLAGFILAYIKRDETAGTIWHSHFENAIHTSWVSIGFFLFGLFTFWFFFLGFVVWGVGYIYFVYRTVKGLIRAIEGQPYV